MAFSPHNFKIFQPSTWNFFVLVIPLSFFLEIGKSYVSVRIIIVSNIAMLVSYNVIIWFAKKVYDEHTAIIWCS